MIEWIQNGNIFDSKCHVLVNPVNAIGPMGRGLAKQFAQRFPGHEDRYKRACSFGMKPGGLWLDLVASPAIMTFATKDHWRDPSQVSYIITGLQNFTLSIRQGQAANWSFAFPPLGCGLGGLDWDIVKSLIEQYLDKIPNRVEVYCPHADV